MFLNFNVPSVLESGNEHVQSHLRRLPQHFRSKDQALHKLRLAERARRNAESEQRQERREYHDQLDREITALQRHKDSGRPFPEADEERLKELITERDAITSELRAEPAPGDSFKHVPKAERAIRAFMNEFAPPVSEYLARCDSFTRFVSRRAELPKTSKGRTLVDVLKEGQPEQDHVIAQILANDNWPLDLETALDGMRRGVRGLAEKGAPNVAGVCTFKQRTIGGRKMQGKIRWPEEPLFVNGLETSVGLQLGNATLAWMFQDQLEARLEAMIRERYKDSPGRSIAERTEIDKTLRAKLIELQRVESRIVAEMLARGEIVEVRPLHPLAWLECELGPRAKAKPAPETHELPAGSAPSAGIPLTAEQAAGWTVTRGKR